MAAYFARRLLLVPVTFLAITLMVYSLLRVAPGGPIEQAETKLKMGAMSGEGGGGGSGGRVGNDADLQLDEDALEELKVYYALDRPIIVGYLQWLGVWPRPSKTRVPKSTQEVFEAILKPLHELNDQRNARQAELEELLAPHGLAVFQGRIFRPLAEEEQKALKESEKDFYDHADSLVRSGFGKRDELLELLSVKGYTYTNAAWYKLLAPGDLADDPELPGKVEALIAAVRLAGEKFDEIGSAHGFVIGADGTIRRVEYRFSGILELDFGNSYTYGEPMIGLVWSKMEVSVQFGLAGFLLSWLVCVPLGVYKAVQHRTFMDSASSFLVFLGYSMPGFVVCLLMLLFFSVQLGWLPLGGYKPEGIENMGAWEALAGRIRHMVIPISGYVIGSFATMTILMKNSLLENLSQDYVRTALAKGLPEKRVIFVHALRNSLIPITAGIGHAVGILFAGSFLIEKTCNIDGIGLMGYQAVMQRDYPIIMGTLVIGVLIQLFGNILSDLIWAAIDPRIRFGGGS